MTLDEFMVGLCFFLMAVSIVAVVLYELAGLVS